jgi:hypothetical protein
MTKSYVFIDVLRRESCNFLSPFNRSCLTLKLKVLMFDSIRENIDADQFIGQYYSERMLAKF